MSDRLKAAGRAGGLAALIMGAVATSALAQTYPAHPDTSPAITAADLSARDRALADDAFQGRGPGTAAGEAAAQWIADEMLRIGLKPGANGSWFQDVPAIWNTLDAAHSTLSFATAQGTYAPNYPDDLVYWTTPLPSGEVKVANSPLVFAGYGTVAPEYSWDDYAGVDVRGKTVVVLMNDPGSADLNPDPKFFEGRAMSYYGRARYKMEEASRHGAAAIILVNEMSATGNNWEAIRNSSIGATGFLDVPENATDVPLQIWISRDTAEELFRKAGMDFGDAKSAANRPGFRAVAMPGEALNADARYALQRFTTRNVVGVIPGSEHPEDVVMFTAHWDHLGVVPATPGSDKIYNGALDNASGVSAMLELAQAFAAEPAPPKRTIAFVAWTLEEQGLLGSRYFALHPLWPLGHIVGGVNFDILIPDGPARDMVIVGTGRSDLEELFALKLRDNGRSASGDPAAQGGFFRSDQFSLAEAGVPMLFVNGGLDLNHGGWQAGVRARGRYFRDHYHQPSDEWQADWDFSGIAADLAIVRQLGDQLANTDIWPNWHPGNMFRPIRDKSRAGQQ